MANEPRNLTLRESRALLRVCNALDSVLLTLEEKQAVIARLCFLYGAETPVFPDMVDHFGWRCSNCDRWVEPKQVTHRCKLCGGQFSRVHPEEIGEQYMTEQEIARADAQRGMGRRHPRKQREIR